MNCGKVQPLRFSTNPFTNVVSGMVRQVQTGLPSLPGLPSIQNAVKFPYPTTPIGYPNWAPSTPGIPPYGYAEPYPSTLWNQRHI